MVSPPPVGVALEGSQRWPCWSTTHLSSTRRTAIGSIGTSVRPAASSASRPPGSPSCRSWLPGTSVTRAFLDKASSASKAMGLFSRMPRRMAGSGGGGLSSMGTSSSTPNCVRPLRGGHAAVTSRMSPSRTSSLSGSEATCAHSSGRSLSALLPTRVRFPPFLLEEVGLLPRHLRRQGSVVPRHAPPGDVRKPVERGDHGASGPRLPCAQRHLAVREGGAAWDAAHHAPHRAQEAGHLRASHAPARTAANPSRLEAATYASAEPARPSSKSRRVSYSYVEKVV